MAASAEAPKQSEQSVGRHVPLVEFIQHDHADARQKGIAHELTEQHALRDVAYLRVGARAIFEADGITDEPTYLASNMSRHVGRRQASR